MYALFMLVARVLIIKLSNNTSQKGENEKRKIVYNTFVLTSQ